MNSIVSTWLLLFGLAVAWVLVLAPDIIRRTSAPRRHDAMSQFTQASRNLSSVQRASAARPRRVGAPGAPRAAARQLAARPQPMRPVGPVRRSAQQQRRQDVLLGLSAAAVLTFLGAISVGGALIVVHFVVDIALVAYLGAMASLTRREKVRATSPQMYSSHVASHMVPAYEQRRRVAR